MGTSTATARRRRGTAGQRLRLVGFGTVAVSSAAVLTAGLLSPVPPGPEPPRPLSAAESERLAAIRVTNYRDGRAGIRASLGDGAARIEVTGRVDWARPLLYLAVGGPGAGDLRGLVQALPSTVMLRPGTNPTPTVPPTTPPPDGWRLRVLAPESPLASLFTLVFSLGARRPDHTDVLGAAGARWIARETEARGPVDVFQTPTLAAIGPTVVPDDPFRTEPVRFWVDRDARLHRLQARLAGALPLRLELDRRTRAAPPAIAALGGRASLPRSLRSSEAHRLRRMPARTRARGGATVALTLPTLPTANLRGGGWLDWTAGTAYLALDDLDAPGRRTVLRADHRGVSTTRAPVMLGPGDGRVRPPRPPLPAPTGQPWRTGSWAGRASRDGAPDVDLLIGEALRLGGRRDGFPATGWLRRDRLDGRPVEVLQSRGAARSTRLRYWIDRSGLLRRLELRTRAGVYAQLDLLPGRVPRLPATAGKAPAGHRHAAPDRPRHR